MQDDRILMLLKQRSVRCTLRKQPQELTKWWYDALSVYSNLWVRPDHTAYPVKAYLSELFALLKLVALPNNPERKKAQIDQKWPELKAKIDGL